MKKFYSKKKGWNVLAVLLVCCLLAGMVAPYSVKAQDLQPDDFTPTGVEVSNIVGATGVKVNYPNAAEWWQRISTKNAYGTEQGIHMEITDISVVNNADYSFAIAFGNGNPMNGDTNQWSDKAGYMLVYGKGGHFEVFPTAGVNTAPVANTNTKLVSVEREALAGSLTLDLKLVDDSYVMTINGDTYTIPAKYADSNKAIIDPTNLYFAFGILGGTDKNTGDAKWEDKLEAGTSFVIAEISNDYATPEMEEVHWDETEIFSSSQANCTSDANYVIADNAEKGMKITHSASTVFYARTNTKDVYSTQDGVHLEITDIACPSDDNYSIGVSIGNTVDQWYDKTGYMIVYGSKGNLSIVATSAGGNITNGATIVSVVREPLNGSLSMNVQLKNNDYVITVNGDTYVIPATHRTYPLTDVSNLYVGVGVMPGGSVSTMDLLKTYSDATFTIKQITDEIVVGLTEEFGYERTEGITLENTTDGVKASYGNDSTAYADFVQTVTTYDVSKGVHLEVKNIASNAGNYSFAIAFGNAEEQWYGQSGYMVTYGKDGQFIIAPMDPATAAPVSEEEALVSIKREAFTDSIVMDMKLVDTNYVITLNGATYTIPAVDAENPIQDTTNLRFAFGVPEAGGAEFVIAEVSDAYKAPMLEEVDTTNIKTFVKEDASYKDECVYVLGENDGVKITHTSETAFYARVNTVATRNAEDGIRMEIADIASPSDEDYSVAISIGNSSDQWYDKTGYMLVYGSTGQFSIVATSGNAGTHIQHGEVMVSLKREPMGDSLAIDIKLQDGNYVFTVNGVVYTIPAVHSLYPLGDVENLYVGVGMMDAGKISELDLLKQLPDATFTISKLYSKIESQKEEVDNRNTVPPEGIGVEGTGFRFEETEKGLVVTHVKNAAAWERIYYKKAYLVEDDGVKLEIEDIASDSENYSLVIGIGGSKPMWFDQKGCMILYGKSGNLAIVAPSGVAPEDSPAENLNDAKVLHSKKLEKYKDSLSVQIKQQGDNYVLVINGTEFVISGKYLDNSEQIFLSLGIMSDYTLKNGDISDLKYYEADFKDCDVSFTITGLTGEIVGEEKIEGNAITPEEAGVKIEGSNIILHKAEKGTKVIHTAQAASWERVSYKNAFSPLGNGIHVEMDEITSKAKNYSIAVKIGSNGSWYDTRGYMIIYGRSGNFSIVATDGSITNPNASPVLVSEVREALGRSFTLDVKLKGTNYQITVNGKTYTVPAQHIDYPIENPKELYLAFGVMSDGKIGEIDYYGNTFKRHYVSFVLTDVSGMISTENQGKPFGMYVSGYNWKLSKTSKGVKVTQGVDGMSWEHVSMEEPYKTTEGGIQIELVDIVSKDSNYSVAVAIGNDKNPWYDTCGYMILYGKSGNFAIIATDATVINPNNSPVVVSEVREELGDALSVNIRLMDDEKNYAVTVNGKVYTIPAEHEDFELEYTDIVYVSFGLMSDGKIGDLVYNKEYKKGETSFTVASVYHSEEDVIDEVKTEEEPKKEDAKTEEPKEDVASEEPVNVTAFVIGGSCILLLVVLAIIIAVLKLKKKKVGGEE